SPRIICNVLVESSATSLSLGSALTISDDNKAPWSRPLPRGLQALASLRGWMRGVARDDDDSVPVRALRHGDCLLQDPVFMGKRLKSSASRAVKRILQAICLR